MLALVTMVLLAAAEPTGDDADQLCRLTGEAPNVSVPPRDRLWFNQNCVCDPSIGCGSPTSSRFLKEVARAQKRRADASARERAAAAAAAKAARAVAARVAAARARTARARAAFLACRDTPGWRDCTEASEALDEACREHGLRAESIVAPDDECYGETGPALATTAPHQRTPRAAGAKL